MLEVYKSLPETGIAVVGPLCDGILLKEFQTAAEADFLAGIDERLGAGKGEAKHGAGIPGRTFALELGSAPGVFVVVGGEGKAEGFLGEAGGVTCNVLLEVGHALGALCKGIEQVMELPGVVGVEGDGRVCKVVAFGLGKEVDVRVVLVHLGKDSVPELCGDLAGGVAAEAVHALFKPETHGVVLGPPNLLILIVEAAGVGPVVLPDGVAFGIPLVEVGGLFRHPYIVRGGLVGNPVKDYLESACMGGVQKMLEVFHGAEFRVHLLVVGDCVVGAKGSFSALGANLIHWHKPKDIHAKVLQAGKLGLNACEGSLRGELADVDLIDN